MSRSERGSSFQLEGLSSTRPGMVEPRLEQATKSLWEEAIRSRFFPQIPREWEWPFPWIWIDEMLIPWAEIEDTSPEDLVASESFATSLDLALFSRFLTEDEARLLLNTDEPPRFRGDTFDFGDCSHEFRHLCALALLLRSDRYWLGQFLTRCSYDLAYEALLAASDLCAFDPARTELRGWFRGAADALEFDRRNGA